MAVDPSFPGLIAEYARQTRLKTSEIDPETLEIRFPNGLSGSIPQDVENVLWMNDVVRGKLTRQQLFDVVLVVGAALQRDGLMPERYHGAIEAIGGPEA
jgi:hypothetical protein